MHNGFPNKIRIILTDNGKQFTTHHAGKKGQHIFRKACEAVGIEHRLIFPYQLWTNGQVGGMSRILKEATIKKFYYKRHELFKKTYICL